MDADFINLTAENLSTEHLCCIIRSKKPHPGVEKKREWLRDRLKEGHVFRQLDAKSTVFIEYAPLETAWVPIEGRDYLYIYCLWVSGEHKGRGYGKALMEYCLNDARAQGKAGVCMLGPRNKRPGFLINPSPRGSAFKPWTPPKAVMICWLCLLTEPYPTLRNAPENQRSKNRDSPSITVPNALLSFKISGNYSGTARRRGGRPLSIRWIHVKKRRNCPVFLIITRFFTMGSFRP